MATIHLEESTRAIPLAAACLKAAATRHEVELMDFTLQNNAQDIADQLLADKTAACIGFPVYLWNRKLVLDVISRIKNSSDIALIAGGPDVTAAAIPFLEESSVDLLMLGEGEDLINPVLDAIESKTPFPQLPGLTTSDFVSQRSAFCSDINKLESPILSGALDLSRNRGLLWELSRGCPFACEFCFESKGSGKVRVFELDRVRQELQAISEAGIEQVFVLDPTFNINKKRVLTIIDWIREISPDTYFYFEVRTEFIDRETAEAFGSIPCTLQIGLQSASPDVLKNINRLFDPDEFKAKTDILGEAGVSFGVDLIYGLPGDTVQGFRDSINYALSLEPNHLDLFPLALLPGTTLYDRRGELGIEADQSDPYIVRKTPAYSPADLKAAEKLSEACDSLYNKNQGISWFSRVCYDLEMNGVELVDRWIERNGPSSSDTPFLRNFLFSLYKESGKSTLYTVLDDLLSYIEILEKIEQSESSTTPEEQILLEDNLRLSLHPSCINKLLKFHPGVVTSGFPDSSENLVRESGLFRTLFWLRDYELCMDLLDEEEWKVIEILKNREITYKELKSHYKGIDEFIISGILEAYISVSGS